MMRVFEAALQAIQTHRCYRTINSDGSAPRWACSGCSWTDSAPDGADIHLAKMIDKAVD